MNVLHLHTGLLSGAGIERLLVDIMNNNKEVASYLCIINDKWSDELLKQIENSDAILLCSRQEGTKSLIKNLQTLNKIIKFIKKNNIYIVHCHNTFSLKIAYILKKILNIKVVFTVHDTNVFNGSISKYNIEKYIAISNSVYVQVNEYIPSEKIKLIYNGVNLNKFITPRECQNQEKDVVRLACVARIMPEKKGQDILIKALSVLKEKYKYEKFICYFAGSFNSKEVTDDLNLLIKHFDLCNNVKFLGNVDNVEKLYSETDIFVLPSRYEGFGLVVIEALAAGCAVVVSKVDGPLEIVKETEEYGLHFGIEDYNELADKLYWLMSDDKIYQRYSCNENTMKYLEENFSLDSMIAQYNEIYRGI